MQDRLQTQYNATTATSAPPRQEIAQEINNVLRNTYALLAMTLAFSAVTAGGAILFNVPFLSPWITLLTYFGLLFAVAKTQNSAWGLLWVFALTGWLGFTIGPILNVVLSMQNGAEMVMFALGGTAAIFFGMSAIALVTRKDFSFMANFLFVGILVAFIAAIANLFLQMPGVALAVSSMFLLLSSGLILWQTSEIIHGGERNYISATVTLYVSLYNVFMSLLHLIMAFGGDD